MAKRDIATGKAPAETDPTGRSIFSTADIGGSGCSATTVSHANCASDVKWYWITPFACASTDGGAQRQGGVEADNYNQTRF